ncbi:MAG TPA: phage tail assembly chaperone [Allosphingosinicella sp.]|nr:phage tail assembly chaperone [Allosphingosinicella sp.]
MERFSEAAARLAGLAGALLGWRPDEFWRSTPAEMGAVLEALIGPEPEPASRADLDRLMERFPDGRRD